MARLLQTSLIVLIVTMYGISAKKMDCGDMDAKSCKMEFSKMMEDEFKMMHMEMMKKNMMGKMDCFAAMMKEMPEEGAHAKMMKKSMDGMKANMDMMDMKEEKKMDNYWDAGKMISSSYMMMKPDFSKADAECKDDAAKMKEMMEKSECNNKMMDESMEKMMMDFENMFSEMYNDLRDMDKKEYPQYEEMNEMMKKMKDESDKEEKMKMMMMMMKKMKDFNKTPYMHAMLDSMCADC